MGIEELKSTIVQAGGGALALEYAKDLLIKIENLERHGVPKHYFRQFEKSANPGDLRGRVLEINLANYFALRKVPLQYEVKQGNSSGDIDLLWRARDRDVYIEVKLLGQDQQTTNDINTQIDAQGAWRGSVVNTCDVMRIQGAIIEKSTTKKFEYPAQPNNVNLVAIDISELQLGMVDVCDCILATHGPDHAREHFHDACIREEVVGLFEKTVNPLQADWLSKQQGRLARRPHPRDYIHGVIFLFRTPRETAALSYDIESRIAWNSTLISRDVARDLTNEFHKVVPKLCEK